MAQKISIPKGPVQERWYAVGYQAAMRDIADRLAAGGEEAVRTWVKDNTVDRLA